MMRRILYSLVLVGLLGLLLGSQQAKAQPKAIGLRWGWNLEAAYEHTLGPGFILATAGVAGYSAAITASASYNWVPATWGDRNAWEFFVGGGLGLANYFWTPNVFVIGPMPCIGIQYSFWFPLMLTINWKPLFGVGIYSYPESSVYGVVVDEAHTETHFFLPGLYDFALTVSYTF